MLLKSDSVVHNSQLFLCVVLLSLILMLLSCNSELVYYWPSRKRRNSGGFTHLCYLVFRI
jgi:hypothetical protein